MDQLKDIELQENEELTPEALEEFSSGRGEDDE